MAEPGVRERLRGAAVELIVERGWSAVSTRMLAERAGVAPGVVHYHFGSVRALLREAALGVLRGLVDQLTEALPHGADDTVRLLVSSLSAYDGTDPTSLLFTETYLAATRDAELRDELARIVADLRTRLAERLAGVPDAEATAAVLAASVDGILLHRALGPGLDPPALRRVLRRLVAPRTGTEQA